MKKRYNFLFVLAIPTLFLLFTSEVLYHTGSPGGKTGSPGDGGNNCTDCHAGTAVVEEFWIYAPNLLLSGYEPGETYDVVVVGIDPDANKFGFEATAEDASGNKVGTFQAGFGGFTQTINNAKAITHTALGNTPIADTGTVFFFSWVAPNENVGDITFYTAVNAANGNGNNSGDQIHLSSFSTSPLSVGVAENNAKEMLVYPNPATGIVNINRYETAESEIMIFNSAGQVVHEEKINRQQFQLDLTTLTKGVYFIKMDNETRQLVLR